ncbi:MAG: hypothetical protein RIR48_3411 [Bacteroidota bacterium]
MIKALLMVIGEFKLMVRFCSDGLKAINEPDGASDIICRKVPGPVSDIFVTSRAGWNGLSYDQAGPAGLPPY